MRWRTTTMAAPRRNSRHARPMRRANSSSSPSSVLFGGNSGFRDSASLTACTIPREPVLCNYFHCTLQVHELMSTKLTHRQILIVFAGLMAGNLLAALDGTIVATALPTIVGDLGHLDHLAWVVTAYLLTTTVSTPLYGKLSDLYGRRLMFQVAI